MCRNSPMLDFLSISSSDRAGFSIVWTTGSGFTVKANKQPQSQQCVWWQSECVSIISMSVRCRAAPCFSPGSRTLLRSGSGLSSVTFGLRGLGPSRSLSPRGFSRVWLPSSFFELLPLVTGPGRDDGGAEISSFLLRSLPVRRRLTGDEQTNSPEGCQWKGGTLSIKLFNLLIQIIISDLNRSKTKP